MRRLALGLFLSCAPTTTPTPAPPAWSPGLSYASAPAANARGYLDRKGVVHAHSVYSYDACDGQPKNASGQYDQN